MRLKTKKRERKREFIYKNSKIANALQVEQMCMHFHYLFKREKHVVGKLMIHTRYVDFEMAGEGGGGGEGGVHSL